MFIHNIVSGAVCACLFVVLAGCKPPAGLPGTGGPSQGPVPTSNPGYIPAKTNDFRFTPKTARDAVARAYKGILGRDADEGGLNGYTEGILRDGYDGWLSALISISESEEFKNNVQPNLTDRELLAQIYEGLLGPNRALDPAGEAGYLDDVAAGRVTGVVLSVGQSDEFFEKVLPWPDTSRGYVERAVSKLYKAILWRDADSGGLAGHSDHVQQNGIRGWRETVHAFANSEEFKQNVDSAHSDEEVLAQLYEGLLGPNRPVDEAGLSEWLPLLKAGKTAQVAEAIATSDEFFEKMVPEFVKRDGPVRLQGRTLIDDTGEFNALGATLFSATRWYKFDRPRLERQLETLARNGYDYIRVLGVVAWQGREIDPRWPDYQEVIAGLTDLAYDKYGIRIQWTIFGDAQIIVPSRSEQQRIVEQFLQMSRGREHKIIMIEIANEYWQNGFGGEDGKTWLRSFARYLNDNTQILVATSAAAGDPCEDMKSLNEGGITDVGIMHFDRDVGKTDGQWRPVRQP
ncbi:MAG TPA: DUF4214 domain-containing protein, partial [Bdellovibrionales bacterium]|nr:DUF4214 domain-containing protein [Bdellovibrionales bacterium]